VDLERGHFYETGLPSSISAISEHIMAPDRYLDGLRLTRDITTVVDMGAKVSENAWALLTSAWDNPETPLRTWIVPRNPASEQDDPSAALGNVEGLVSKQGQRVRVLSRSVKFLSDGAFYSQLMKMGPPGYIDGHHGEWLTEPDQLEAAVRPFWQAGYQIHVHANGDAGIDATLDILETMLEESPRPDHRFALHHYGYSTQAQARRVAKLGAVVSAQPFYLWTLADTYAELGLGHDRAAQISRLGSLVREGVPVSLHSDFTMAPASPLTLASAAVTSRSATGKLWAPQERLTKIEGLEAITIDAAYAVGLEDEIGSVEAGKKATLVVLAENPLDIDAGRWPDIEILATILEDVIFETQ
jgi:predicted amidohydrolase YtcJ